MAGPAAMPRALERLEAAIAATANPLDRARLQAERAAMLARLGRMEEAADARVAALGERGPAAEPSISIALAMAEAMADFYRDFNLAARDRLRRAHALASAARLRPQQALAAAWLAHIDYLQHDLPALARHLDEAFGHSDDQAHDTRARACLVVAQALHWAGDEAGATPWYTRARAHAQAAGDDATRSALMHNQAWLRGVQAREALLWAGSSGTALGTGPSPSDVHVQAARNLDRWIDSRSLDASLSLLEALLAVDRGDAELARSQLQALAPVLVEQGLGHLRAWAEADQAWCCLVGSVPDAQSARAHAQAALGALEPQQEPEDRALTHARLAQVQQRLGDAEAAAHHALCAEADTLAHRQRQQAMREALAPLVARHVQG